MTKIKINTPIVKSIINKEGDITHENEQLASGLKSIMEQRQVQLRP